MTNITQPDRDAEIKWPLTSEKRSEISNERGGSVRRSWFELRDCNNRQVCNTPNEDYAAALVSMSHRQSNQSLEDKLERVKEALESIAASVDAGRHDGLPEESPEKDEVHMWCIAKEALAMLEEGW